MSFSQSALPAIEAKNVIGTTQIASFWVNWTAYTPVINLSGKKGRLHKVGGWVQNGYGLYVKVVADGKTFDAVMYSATGNVNVWFAPQFSNSTTQLYMVGGLNPVECNIEFRSSLVVSVKSSHVIDSYFGAHYSEY